MKGDRPVDVSKSDDSTLDGAYFDVSRETCNLFALPDLRATKEKRKKGGEDAEKDFFA